jgi:hypothetical protein
MSVEAEFSQRCLAGRRVRAAEAAATAGGPALAAVRIKEERVELSYRRELRLLGVECRVSCGEAKRQSLSPLNHDGYAR